MSEIFASIAAAFGTVLADYDDDQLAFLLDFLLRLNDTAREVTAELTAQDGSSPTTR